MFGKVDKKAALELIKTAVAECETRGDFNYTVGLLDMAEALSAITHNEVADFKEAAAKNMQKK